MPRRRRFRPNLPLWLAVFLFLGAIAAYIGLGVLVNGMTPRRAGMPSTLYLVFVARCLDATLAVWFFSVGASIGSFLNVVAYRLPLGRTLNGHSACPFCTTQIAASDNIPVFAWLRLRGRCRTCHLPIAVQYPLVELAVGLVFLAMYFLEFGVAGTNLPGSGNRPEGIGLIWMSVSRALVARVLLALYLLSGLIAAALMLVRGSRVPLVLFLWLALVLVMTPVVLPEAIIVPWWGLPAVRTMSVVDAGITLATGMAGGIVLGAVTVPLVGRINNNPKTMEPMSGLDWMGALVCLGLLVGWQALPLAVAWILLASLAANLILKATPWRGTIRTRRPIVWAWLGFVLFRATWKSAHGALHALERLPDWSLDMLPLLVVFPLAWLAGEADQEASRVSDKASGHELEQASGQDSGLPDDLLSPPQATNPNGIDQ